MIGRRNVLAFLLITVALASGLPADPASPTKGLLTSDQWIADLRFLAEHLPKTHRPAFDKVTPEAFAKAVADLEAEIPNLDDHQVVLGPARHRL